MYLVGELGGAQRKAVEEGGMDKALMPLLGPLFIAVRLKPLQGEIAFPVAFHGMFKNVFSQE